MVQKWVWIGVAVVVAVVIAGELRPTVGEGVVAGRTWTRTAAMERWSTLGWVPSPSRERDGDVTEWRVDPPDPLRCDPLVAGCERIRARTEALWLVLDDGRRCRAEAPLWEALDAGAAVTVRASPLGSWCSTP